MLSKSHSKEPDDRNEKGKKRRLTTIAHLPPARQEGEMGAG